MKTRLKIIIPAAIALIAIAAAFVCIKFAPAKTSDFSDLSAMIQTANKFLNDHEYEQAIAEFEKAIKVDPMNVEAYIGIAKSFVGLGDTDKAAEWLEKGYDLTGDERLKEMLDELLSPQAEIVTEVTTVLTEETIISSVSETTSIDNMKADEIKQIAYDSIISQFIGCYSGKPNSTAYFSVPRNYYILNDNEVVFSDFTPLKIEYGSDGEWIKETYIGYNWRNGNTFKEIIINERQFTGNTFMKSTEYNLSNKKKYISSSGWKPSSAATNFYYENLLTDFIFENKNDNIYTYSYVYNDYDVHFKKFYDITYIDDKIIKIELRTSGDDYTYGTVIKEDENGHWGLWPVSDDSRYMNTKQDSYTYVDGLTDDAVESDFEILESMFTEVYTEDELYG